MGMTTNHIDDLDPAIIRPGRIDQQYCLKNCNEIQIRDMCRNFHDDAEEKDIDEMVKLFKTIKNPIAPAQFENFLVQFKLDLPTAISNINELEKVLILN